MTVAEEIQKLKKEKDAIILAHYYVRPEVQDVADYIGDSFYLSKIAASAKEKTIVFCGVGFMGESAKILSPDKTVLMPAMDADCPMAHMATEEGIRKVREEYDDVAVVCYINSTAALKELSDVCVTSANAVKIVKALPNKNIFFIPDRNLAHFIAEQVPEKHFIYNEGFCIVHEFMDPEEVKEAKARIRKAQKRCKELDVLIQKLYESYALEKISEKRFDDFLAAYEKEQAELKAVLETDTEELRAYEVDSDHIASFLKLARTYREADELTTPMIYAFVEKIIVHAPEKIDGERHMQIDIYLKFIGNFQGPQDEPTAEEMAEEEKQKQRRAKNREKVARCMERKKLKDAQEKEDAAHENDSAV